MKWSYEQYSLRAVPYGFNEIKVWQGPHSNGTEPAGNISDSDEVIPGKRTKVLTKDQLISGEDDGPSPSPDRAMPRVDPNPFLPVLKVPLGAGGRSGCEPSLAYKLLCT